MSATKLRHEPKSIIFDLMGTCLDWHAAVTGALEYIMPQVATRENFEPPTGEDNSRLALEWRQGFFDEIHARFQAGEDPEDIDETHHRVLRRLLNQQKWACYAFMSKQAQRDCVWAWHSQSGTCCRT